MLNTTFLKAVPLTIGLLFISACATTSAATQQKVEAAPAAKTMADDLTQTNSTVKSADGTMICKRTAVVGSNFKRKICATAEEWEARAAADRTTAGNIQRGGQTDSSGN